MAEQPDLRNEINGTVSGRVIQCRDVKVKLTAAWPVAVAAGIG